MLAAESRAVPPPAPNVPVASPAWKQIAEPVEPFLEAVGTGLARQVAEFDPALAGYADYTLAGHGKQLRATLVGLTGLTTGGLRSEHATAAVIIELVHLATLVHDDVMDEAELRRGRLTLAAHWSNEVAVLFGDCLFAHALTLAAGFPTTDVCLAVSRATKTVCSGEIIQNQHRLDFDWPIADYLRVLEMKTGELFALSCDLAGFLNGASPRQRTALRGYGMALGLAYQIYDDCLDVFGSETLAGKSLKTDLAKGKLTLPLLLVRDEASGRERALLERWLNDWQPQFAPRLLDLLQGHRALERSLQQFRRSLARAEEALRGLPDRGSQLAPLTGFLEEQAAQLEASS